jgi:hypothetical protein
VTKLEEKILSPFPPLELTSNLFSKNYKQSRLHGVTIHQPLTEVTDNKGRYTRIYIYSLSRNDSSHAPAESDLDSTRGRT